MDEDGQARMRRHGSEPPDEQPRSIGRREWTPLARALAATGDHWTLAIALELAPGRMRLKRLRERMPGVSTGVLDRHLTQMVRLALVTRERFREKPPRVEIELTQSGRELVPIACALARWGMRHVWSEPSVAERVDVDALLRMLPALLDHAPSMPTGSIEASVEEPDRGSSQSSRHVICDEAGRPRLLHDGAGRATEPATVPVSVSVRGTPDAWIAALGPARELGQLQINGNAALATRMLQALPHTHNSSTS